MNEVAWRKKISLLDEVLRLEAVSGNGKSGSSSRPQNGFRKFIWPPKLFNNPLLPLMAFRGGLRWLLRSVFGSQQTAKRVSSGCRRRSVRGRRGRLRRKFRNLKQFVETVNKCCQSRSKIFSNIQNLTRMEFKIIISNDFKLFFVGQWEIKLPGI